MTGDRPPGHPPAGALAKALAAHEAGRLDEAERLYRIVLDADPASVPARHYLGVVALQRGDPAAAQRLIEAALADKPADPAILANLGLALLERAAFAEAASRLREAVRLDDSNGDAWLNLGLAEQGQDRVGHAAQAFERALVCRPDSVAALAALVRALVAGDRADEAEARVRQAPASLSRRAEVRLAFAEALAGGNRRADAAAAFEALVADEPASVAGWLGLSAVRRRLDDPVSAQAAAERACELAPADPATHRQLGLALKEQGRLADACAHFERYLELARRPDAPVDVRQPTYARTSAAKLRHDAEQIDYLRARDDLPERFDAVAADYRAVLARVPATVGDRVFLLPPDVARRFRPHYNRLHLRRAAGRCDGGAVSPRLDRAAIERDYRSRAPGITWVDDLLTDEALARLRRFCLESTIWFDFNHNNGYLGAYLEEGFFCPLLLQIADELRAALPAIFGDHPLMQMWAYKYGQRVEGIDMHADFAAVNVNFWLTPTQANLDTAHGGLVVWDVEAPPAQTFEQYNSSEPAAQARIRRFLDDAGATPVTVPYRANRAVIFNSDLFHKTDTIRFRPGYENRRINVTMLFGRREGA